MSGLAARSCIAPAHPTYPHSQSGRTIAVYANHPERDAATQGEDSTPAFRHEKHVKEATPVPRADEDLLQRQQVVGVPLPLGRQQIIFSNVDVPVQGIRRDEVEDQAVQIGYCNEESDV